MLPESPTSPLIYLDNAATTPLCDDAFHAMLPHLRGEFGNPSTLHSLGVRARSAMNDARDTLSRVISSRPSRIVFTGSGTEANNLAIQGLAAVRRGERIVTSVAEHPSVGRAVVATAKERGVESIAVGTDLHGVLDLDALASALTPKTTLVALIHTQNETGVIQPIRAAAAIVRERAPRAFLHVDAIQSFGKLPLDEVTQVADSMAVSSHKIHGPKGVGALALFTNSSIPPSIHGGGQEGGLRSGTENVAGIVGFAAAASVGASSVRAELPRMERLATQLRRGMLAVDDVTLLGGDAPQRSPFVTGATVAGVRGETLQHHLEQIGIVIGTGSACHSAKREVSASLRGLGLDHDRALSVIRISLSHATDANDVDRFLREFARAVPTLREFVA